MRSDRLDLTPIFAFFCAQSHRSHRWLYMACGRCTPLRCFWDLRAPTELLGWCDVSLTFSPHQIGHGTKDSRISQLTRLHPKRKWRNCWLETIQLDWRPTVSTWHGINRTGHCRAAFLCPGDMLSLSLSLYMFICWQWTWRYRLYVCVCARDASHI